MPYTVMPYILLSASIYSFLHSLLACSVSKNLMATDKTTSPTIASDMDTSCTANLTKVLSELKSLQTDFGTKLDNIETRCELHGFQNDTNATRCRLK